ncbi:MAG: hypothetical protein AB7V46_07090 [Thermomicrobiales bacterium]
MTGRIADEFDLEITEAERKRLSPEEMKRLEEAFRKLKSGDIEVSM